MSTKRLWFWVTIAGISGCGVAKELVRNAGEELKYHNTTEECLTNVQHHRLATSYWHDYRSADPDCVYSHDFEEGFKDGFKDFLDGGSGEPPVVPPRCYWKVFHQTEVGHERAEDWFQGFRMGAIAAEQSGHRSWVTLPVSRPDYSETDPALHK